MLQTGPLLITESQKPPAFSYYKKIYFFPGFYVRPRKHRREERVGEEKGLLCVIVAPVTTVYLVLFC